MYVGITRAMEELYISRGITRTQFGRTQRNPPSMFLAEIPDDCIFHKDRTDLRGRNWDDEDVERVPLTRHELRHKTSSWPIPK